MYQNAVKMLLMNVAERRRRLIELRGNRTQDEIGDLIGVTGTAVYNWEKKGTVSRKNAKAYDDALGAGGEVLNMLGYTADSGASVTTIERKVDRILELVEQIADSQRRRRNERDATPTEMPRPVLHRNR